MTNTHEIISRPAAPPASGPALRVGIDIAQISAIGASVEAFGERFLQRFFSPGEIAYARQAPALTTQRLAARFAAKEAAIKAFGLAEAGIAWHEIEVVRAPGGGTALAWHGRTAELVERCACADIALSLSHDGDYATAMVVAMASGTGR